MDERETIAWLYRRAGFGLAPGQLDDLEARGVGAVIDELVDGDQAGLAPNPDPWAAVTFHDHRLQEFRVADRIAAIRAWVLAMATTPRPTEEWLRWFWHGHLVSGLQVVEHPELMVGQLRTYGELGLGDLPGLLAATTVDPAMLIYLDGAGSVAGAPNENYGRELMELFALGIGNYTEHDIQQAAAALTGWRVNPDTGAAVLVAARHDDTARSFLGVDGVHDVDTVVDAVVAHEACAPHIARSLGEAVLGAGLDDALVGELASTFLDAGLVIRPLLRAVLEAGAEGRGGPAILRPVPWMLGAARALEIDLEAVVAPDGGGPGRGLGLALEVMGQVPMRPPNVSGWPGDSAWLSSSATLARWNAAGVLATLAAPEGAALEAAVTGDWERLADVLGRPGGFGAPTLDALAEAGGAGGAPGVAPLTLALACPEMIQA